MKKVLKLLFVFCLVFSGSLQAQGDTKQANRSLTNQNTYQQPQTSRSLARIALRIEDGKVWLNGNILAAKDLPDGLKNLDPGLFYQTSVFGIDEISFSLLGETYLVNSERIVQLPRVSYEEQMGNTVGVQQKQTNEGYYSDLRRESPALFQSMTYEGKLYEQAQTLVLQYRKAKPKEKEAIREELRVVLGNIFDLNERNRESEIRELEQLIHAAKEEVSYRKSRKRVIVDNAVNELLGY